MKNFILAASALIVLLSSCTVKDSFIEKTLDSLSLEEKAGQMIQLCIDPICGDTPGVKPEKLDSVIRLYKPGSFLNIYEYAPAAAEMAADVKLIQSKSLEIIGIPTIFGLDMNHGASYYKDGTVFPQSINIAATFNPEFASYEGQAVAYETRAGMVPWIFCPTLDLERNQVWSRQWESFGEDPYLQSVMGSALTTAMQGPDRESLDNEHCAVSIKHYLGYGAPRSGKDRTPAYVSESDLREKYFAPFKACIEAGALTLMVNSSSINGVPLHSSYKYLTEWVKEELDWDGVILTDWADINNLYVRDHVAADRKEALAIGINAGIDMIMEPYDGTAALDIVELVKEGKISKARLDDAVRRILTLKKRLGLFDEPIWDTDRYSNLGCNEFAAHSYEAALESEVLLKNEGILPLSKNARILVTGPNANTMRALNGGWTYTWQGYADETYSGRFNTIYEALDAEFDHVSLCEGVSYNPEEYEWRDEYAAGIPSALAAARGADVIVACVGENSYCETPGNIDDLTLSDAQTGFVKALAATGKPIVLVLNEGRPRIIREIEPLCSAIVDIMLPGNYGADALAKLLSGGENFSGKLPITYPKYVNALYTYDYKVSESRETMEGAYNYDATMDVQWPFGTGLSYTDFEYSNLRSSLSEFVAGDMLEFSVDVTNIGDRAGKESVLLYSSDIVASIMPDVKRLRAFDKVALEPGQTKTVTLRVPARDLAFVDSEGRWVLEAGEFRIAAGPLNCSVICKETQYL